eukprot:gene15771-biopygen23223
MADVFSQRSGDDLRRFFLSNDLPPEMHIPTGAREAADEGGGVERAEGAARAAQCPKREASGQDTPNTPPTTQLTGGVQPTIASGMASFYLTGALTDARVGSENTVFMDTQLYNRWDPLGASGCIPVAAARVSSHFCQTLGWEVKILFYSSAGNADRQKFRSEASYARPAALISDQRPAALISDQRLAALISDQRLAALISDQRLAALVLHAAWARPPASSMHPPCYCHVPCALGPCTMRVEAEDGAAGDAAGTTKGGNQEIWRRRMRCCMETHGELACFSPKSTTRGEDGFGILPNYASTLGMAGPGCRAAAGSAPTPQALTYTTKKVAVPPCPNLPVRTGTCGKVWYGTSPPPPVPWKVAQWKVFAKGFRISAMKWFPKWKVPGKHFMDGL